jgi:beta-glucoside operon transcriptional antiterminator
MAGSYPVADDEDSFIALHVINAKLNDEIYNTLDITRVMRKILNIVKYYLYLDYNKEALSYYRFVTNLAFFAQPMLGKNDIDSNDDSLYQAIKEQYPASFICAGKIN